MDKDNTNKIEGYLLGGLSSKEKESFEQELKTDFDLQEEVYSCRIVFENTFSEDSFSQVKEFFRRYEI